MLFNRKKEILFPESEEKLISSAAEQDGEFVNEPEDNIEADPFMHSLETITADDIAPPQPPKKLTRDPAAQLPDMIRETCIAELVHLALCFSGLYCLKLWPGAGGIAVVLIYTLLLNLPFILIQRYNRPRLIRLHQKYLHKQKEE